MKEGSNLAKLFKVGLNLSDGIVVQGDRWVKHLSDLGVSKKKIHLVPSWLSSGCVPIEKGIEVPKGAVIKFIFVGWIVKDKGIRELLKAAEILRKETNHFSLTVVGGGTLYDFCRNSLEENGLGDCVKILGWKERNEVNQLLKESHVFVLPTYHEGFPNALLEAMSFGLPVISTDVGAISESLVDGENGFLVNVEDVDSLVYAMRKYIENETLIVAHSRRALEIVKEKHSLESNCLQIKEILIA